MTVVEHGAGGRTEGSDLSFSPHDEGRACSGGGSRAGVWECMMEGEKGQRKREDSNPAETADLHQGTEPMSRC